MKQKREVTKIKGKKEKVRKQGPLKEGKERRKRWQLNKIKQKEIAKAIRENTNKI